MWSMKLIIVILLATFVAVEVAHLNYHRAEEAKPLNFDKNFWTHISYKQRWSFPPWGYQNCLWVPLATLASFPPCYAVQSCANTVRLGSERSRTKWGGASGYESISNALAYCKWFALKRSDLSGGWAPVSVLSTNSTKRCDDVPYCMHTDETHHDATPEAERRNLYDSWQADAWAALVW